MIINSIAQPAKRSTQGAIDYVLQTPKMRSMDVAAAYITSSGIDVLSQTLNARLGSAKVDKRWVTSFDYCRTEPAALDAILSLPFSSVRIHDANFCLSHHGAPRVPFHPKTFLFRSAKSEFALAGSGNISRSGLSKGHEAGLLVGVSRPPAAADAPAHSALKMLRGWFAATWNAATPLNSILLARYRSLYESVDKLKNPTPTEDDVAAPDSAHGALTEKDLRKLRACGNFWIEAGNITKNRGPHLPGNQLMMKRMSRVFFGFEPKQVPENSFIGSVTTQYAGGPSLPYSLTYSDNKMDKLVLPIPGSDGPASYDNVLLRFRRLKPRQFELSVGSAADKTSWVKKSKAIDGFFSMNSGRQWGVF